MRRGVITLPIVLIMISFFSFCVIVINYSRIHSANLKMSILADSAANSVLTKYDNYLYEEYRIMGVANDVELTSSLNEMAQKTLAHEKSDFNFYGFKNIKISSKKLSDFSQIESFKVSILNSNRDLFLIEGLEKATKLFKFWKTFSQGKSLSDLYSKAIKIMGELQKKYDKCKEVNKMIQETFASLRSGADTVISSQMLPWASDLKSLNNRKEEELSEQERNRKRELEQVVLDLGKIKAGIGALKSKVLDLKNKINDKLPELIEIKRKIDQKKKELDDDEFKSGAQKMMDDIQSYEQSLNAALDHISEIIAKIDPVKEKFERLDSDIQKILSNIEIEEHEEFDLGEELESLKLEIEVFEGKSENVNAGKVIKFMWKAIKGSFFTNYSRFDLDISDELYETLPAVVAHRDKINSSKPELPNESGKSYAEMGEEGLKGYTDFTDLKDQEYQRFKSSNMVESLIDKCTIMDFAFRYFTYNIYEKDGKSIRSLSKNPLYQSEIEYLLHGNKSPKLNMLFTDLQIFGIRNIANSISLLIHKKVVLNTISLSIASFTFGIGYPVAYGVLLFGWSSLESLADIHELHKGNAIPVFKGKNDILIDINANTIDRLINTINESRIGSAYTNTQNHVSQMGSNSSGNSKNSKGKYGVYFDYKDHLFILMTFCEEELLLYRIQDVIQIRGKLKDENFDIRNFGTMYEVDVEADLPLIYSDVISSKITSKSVMGY